MSVLSDRHFHNEAAAYAFVEKRVWPNGPVCPHCKETKRISAMNGESTRIGAYKCYACRKPFTVKVGTIFESSHVKMHLWLQAIYLIASSKKGISSNQLHRTLGVTLKTAWFMSHRIREAMREGGLGPLGGEGKIVEADETYYGKKAGPAPTMTTSGKPFTKSGKTGPSHKRAILSLVERGGNVRTFHVAQANKENVTDLVNTNVARESILMTDESRLYANMKSHVSQHLSTKHSAEEYVRYEGGIAIHSNTVENYFSVFKRGVAPTSIALRNTCIATLQNSISGTIAVLLVVSMMKPAPAKSLMASLASV